MKPTSFPEWARPLLDAIRELERIAMETPGDASMLTTIEQRIRHLEIPDFVTLANDMAAAMSEAVVDEVANRAGLLQRSAMFAAQNPGFEPISAALQKIASKTPVVSKLRTEDWDQVELALRERGQFSSGVESIRVMGSVQAKLLKSVGQQRELLSNGKERYVSRDSFIRDIRQIAMDEGLDTQHGNVLTNIAAPRRIGMIYDMQTRSAAGYARWKLDNDSDALAVLPAWRLSDSTAKTPRADWWERWQQAGSAVGWEGASQRDFVALKTSPIWAQLSRFGTPWPPFDFGSTRDLEDVWRDEAEALGLVEPDETIQPTMEQDFNRDLEATVSEMLPEQRARLQALFGDQVKFQGGKAVWQGNLLGDLARDISDRGNAKFDNTPFKGRKLNLGLATETAKTKAAEAGVDISAMKMVITPDTVYHMLNEHGEGREKRRDQRPISITEIEALPHVWRDPDNVFLDKDGIVFEKRIVGRTQMVGFEKNRDDVLLPVSVRVKRE